MAFRYASESEAPAWRARVERTRQRALQLDPDMAEAHEALAFVYSSTEFDWERTIAEGRRALAINPYLPMPHFYVARAFYHLGLFDKALRETQAGTELDPAYKVEPARIRGITALFDGRFGEAVRRLEEALALSRTAAEGWLAQAYYYDGRWDRARPMWDELRAGPQAQPRSRAQATLAGVLAARGQQAEARILIEQVKENGYMDHHVAYSLGAAFAQLGQPGEARRWLAQAAQTGFPCHPWYERDPLLDPLRRDPEFQRMLAGLEETQARNRARFID
jgi:tetratricopeptide (TPR) repeat protein